MNLYLVGYMGTGKSSVGKRLANRLDMEFVDMDKEVEDYAKTSIADIFENSGEEIFRSLETRVVDRLMDSGSRVVATGGGAPCHSDNMQKLLDSGYVVYLELNPFKIARRLASAKSIRPLVEGKEGKELEDYVTFHLEERRPIYERADMTIDADKVKAVTLDRISSDYKTMLEESGHTK